MKSEGDIDLYVFKWHFGFRVSYCNVYSVSMVRAYLNKSCATDIYMFALLVHGEPVTMCHLWAQRSST